MRSIIWKLLLFTTAWQGLGCLPPRPADIPTETWDPNEPEALCEGDRHHLRWPVHERATLETRLARDEPALVSALGCEVDVLSHCRAEGGYRVTELGDGGRRFELDRDAITAGELEGRCPGATHVVAAASSAGPPELTPLSLGDVALEGTWRGVAHEPGGLYEAYDLRADLEQRGHRVVGRLHVRTPDRAHWGVVRIEGRLEGNVLYYAETTVIDDNLGIFLDWCLVGGYLLLDPTERRLHGPARGAWCRPSNVELRRPPESEDEPAADPPERSDA